MIKRVENTESGFRRNYEFIKKNLFKFFIAIENELKRRTEDHFCDPHIHLNSIEKLKLDFNLKHNDLKRKFSQFKYLEFDLKRNKFTPNTKLSINFSKSLGKLELHQNYLNCLDTLIQNVIVCDFGQVKVDILNLNTNFLIKSLKGHTDNVKCVCMWETKDGPKLITSSLDLTLKIWDLSTDECLKIIHVQPEVVCLKMLANGRLATGAHDSSIQIWNLQTDKCEKLIISGNFLGVMCLEEFFHLDYLIGGSGDKCVRL